MAVRATARAWVSTSESPVALCSPAEGAACPCRVISGDGLKLGTRDSEVARFRPDARRCPPLCPRVGSGGVRAYGVKIWPPLGRMLTLAESAPSTGAFGAICETNPENVQTAPSGKRI